MDTTQKLPAVLSLCSGYGGIERGLSLAGFMHRVVAHVEIETFAIANLVAKMEAGQMDAAPVWSNLKTLPVEPFRDRVDILTGGYPCQPFSAAGKRLGEEDPRHLWPYIKEIIRAVRPVRCFFENVEGHISLGLREVISDLESLGYTTAWGIFSAREVGAPHQRKRVYIMADSSDPRSSRTRIESQHSNEIVEPCDSNSKRESGGGQDWKQGKLRTEGIEQSPGNLWPSRPGQTQHEWEEPRVLADSKNANGPNGKQEGHKIRPQEQYRGGCLHRKPDSQRKAQPRVGRADNGSASGMDASENRYDRLRLLGNGVVPHTAAKAWITLQKQIRKFYPSEE